MRITCSLGLCREARPPVTQSDVGWATRPWNAGLFSMAGWVQTNERLFCHSLGTRPYPTMPATYFHKVLHDVRPMTMPRRAVGANQVRDPAKSRRLLRAATDPLHVSLVLLMVLTVSRVHQQFGFIASVRPALLLVAFAFCQALVSPRFLSEKGLLFTWPPRLIAGFAGMACLSVPFGISVGAAGAFILQLYLPVLVFAALLIVAVRKAADLYAFVWAFVIGGGILAYFANFVFALSNYNGQARLGNMYMYDANDAGLILTVAIPLTLLTLQIARLPGKLLSILFLYWEWTAIARTGSRGAFVGVLAIGLGLLFLANGVSVIKRVGIVVAAALLLIVAAPEGYWKQMKTISNPTQDYNWTERDGRKQIAKRGIKYMLDYPVTGIGIGNFGRAEGTISAKAKNWVAGQAGVRWAAPHNSHIEAGAELGVPGLAIWAAMLIGGIVGPIRLRRRLPRSWSRGTADERFVYAATMYVPISMLGFAVCSTFVSFAYLDPVYVLLAFVSGLAVCADALLRRPRSGSAAQVPPSERSVKPQLPHAS